MNKNILMDKMKIHSLAVKSGGLFAMLGMSRIHFAQDYFFTTIGNIAVISRTPEGFPIQGEMEFDSVYNFLSNFGEEELEINKSAEGFIFGSQRMQMTHPVMEETKLSNALASTLGTLNEEGWAVQDITEDQLKALKLLQEFSGGSDMCSCEIKDGKAYAIFLSKWATVDMPGFPNCCLFATYLPTIWEFCGGKNIEFAVKQDFVRFLDKETGSVLIHRQAQHSDMLDMVMVECEKPRQPLVLIPYSEEIKVALSHATTLCDKRKGVQAIEMSIKSGVLLLQYKSGGTMVKEKIAVANCPDLAKRKVELGMLLGMTNDGKSVIEETQVCDEGILISTAPGISMISRYNNE